MIFMVICQFLGSCNHVVDFFSLIDSFFFLNLFIFKKYLTKQLLLNWINKPEGPLVAHHFTSYLTNS